MLCHLLRSDPARDYGSLSSPAEGEEAATSVKTAVRSAFTVAALSFHSVIEGQ